MSRRLGLLTALLPLAGCFDDEMSLFEALEALEQVDQSARGEQATAEVIEVSTDFTIGEALESAAQAIADFWASQVDCTVVTVDGNDVVIDYGDLDDECVYNGHTYAGVNTITVESTAAGELEVLHDWDGFSNGEVQVDGGATVTWSGEDDSRRVVTEHTWTDLADSTTVDVWGDHISHVLEPGTTVWESGFTLDGVREWTHEAEDWSLEMTALELRLVDPAPQAGSVAVIDPAGKALEIVYERVDEDTIAATLIGIRGGERVYHISKRGVLEEQ